jgi:hypothetical protein
VIVLSDRDGCVIDRSVEANALGFRRGDPYSSIRALAGRQGDRPLDRGRALRRHEPPPQADARVVAPALEVDSIDAVSLGRSASTRIGTPTTPSTAGAR